MNIRGLSGRPADALENCKKPAADKNLAGLAFHSGRKEVMNMALLKDKKAVIIGDRDGIPGPAIAECAKSAGAEVVFSSTECFV